MKPTHRLPTTLIRGMSLCVCFVLVLSCFVITPLVNFDHNPTARAQGQSNSQNGNVEKVEPAPPVAGPPAGNWPNLDEVKVRPSEDPRAPESVNSTLRSRRKPIESRRGRTVGRPRLPLTIGRSKTIDRPDRARRARDAAHTVLGGSSLRSHHARRSLASSFLVMPMPQGGSAQNVVWTNIVGASASGNNLTKTAGDGWGNGGASSTQSITAGDGYVEFTASETDSNRMLGLNHGDPDQSYGDLDYAFFLHGAGLEVYESGVDRGYFGLYTTGDVLRVAIEGGVVKYKKNGTVLYTSTVQPTYPLLVDTSLYHNSSTLTNVLISSSSGGGGGTQTVGWTNIVGASASGNNLTKTAGDGWGNGGASSTQSITAGDGYVEFTASETDSNRMLGLNHGDPDQSYGDLDYAFFLHGAGLEVYESGVDRGYFGLYTTGDVLRVAIEGDVVKYKKNGTVLYTSGTLPSYPLLVDTSLYHNSSTLTNVVMSGAGSGPTADPYVQNFIQWALGRQPSTDEANYWSDMFRRAYAHQQGSMTIAVREMGRTVFDSSEYAGRSRSNHDYVRDLYKTFLRREPDSSGWANWEALVPSIGRDQVRRGFDESTEFANLVSTLTISGTPSSAVSSLAAGRVDPFNQPGSGLSARDAEWNTPLLSLPGRAGLDLGLSLSYSSMVWTRSGPYVYFDEDSGSPSPGFRLGFPTIQEKFFDAQAGVNVYLLVTGGSRVELRQVGTSNVYEAADSSYLQLIDNGSLLVRTTDGTRLSYGWYDHEYRCTEIKDRNGNYLTVNYDWRGDITTIIDTLRRTITFNHDANANLSSITQDGRTQPWVTFRWDNLPMHPALSGVSGTYDGEVIPVITMVGFADSTYYKFAYNGSGQVSRVTHYASDSNPATDNHEVAHTVFNYAAADDATRLSNTHVSAENWTGLNGVPSEVVTQYGIEGDAHTLTVVGDSNGTVYKEFYGDGWQHGLTVRSEVWAGGALQKTTTTLWTQDNTNANYQTNPRVTETNVIDSADNHSRTTITYNTFTLPSGASCSLPADVDEYEANATSIARRSHTDYNLASTYQNARLIGLPQAKFVYEGTSALKAKSTYVYDWGGEYLQNLPTAATQHDGGYSTDFVVGRGNLVDVLRWDVTDPNNSAKALESKMGYDIDGSVLFARDPLNHQTTISYNDAFSAGGTSLDAPRSFATFAYPTMVTDPDSNSSSFWYRYDFGAKTRAQGPPPANQPNGIIQTFSYDEAARIQQVTTANTGAYTHYVYGPNYVQSYSTVNTIAANFLQADLYAIQVFDGAGRVIGAANNHPGSTGGYRLVNTIYDLMGRAVMLSNPGEINNSWVPKGDDAAGLLYTQQSYDWKGRPLLTTNTDGTQKYASYTACGCAGSEVTTLTDEIGRQQKIYSDVLGRTAKTEILQTVNNVTSVYSTTSNIYNARDQVTQVRHYQGADNSSVYQDTTMSYDGYGRLQTKHVPEQDAGTATTYAYNSDNTVNSVTDARSASATYGYVGNNRRLVTSITYNAPSGVTPTPTASFGYDAVGNRISMSDGLGSKTYSYNQLSQLMSEKRTITNVGTFTLSYDYNLAGELKKITDPTNATINYGFDSAGRLTGVTGSDTLYAGVSNYASNLQYRAWGAAKHLNYGNSLTVDLAYNNRGQTTQYDLKNLGGAEVMGQQYQYTSTPTSTDNDGRLKYSHDLVNSNLDRTYSYDQQARLTLGDTANGSLNGPYKQTYGYDEWGNLTSRSWRTFYYNQYCHCMVPQTNYSTSNYSNNRNTATGWNYDFDGRLLGSTDGGANFTYGFDAAGQLISSTEPGRTISQGLDGDGLKARWVENGVTTYYVRSSALGGQTIVELDQYGNKARGYVYGGGQEIAKQEGGQVLWDQRDASAVSMRLTNGSGAVASKVETDPLGTQVSDTSAFNQNGGGNGYDFNPNGFYGDPTMPDMGCSEGGVPTPCNLVQASLRAGGSYQCSGWGCPTSGWNPNRDGPGRGGFFTYRYTDEGVLMDSIGGSQKPNQQSYDPRADFRDYAVQLAKNKNMTDCLKLALLVYKAGQIATDEGAGATPDQQDDVARLLLGGLTEFSDIRPLNGMVGGASLPLSSPEYRVGVFANDPYGKPTFVGSGFKAEFVKPDEPYSNRVRHAAFYIAAGTLLFYPIALRSLHSAEHTSDSRAPDVGLGEAAILMGATYGGNYRNLAQSVWHDLCGQSSNLNLP